MDMLVHGTTMVATSIPLTRTGSEIGLITTASSMSAKPPPAPFRLSRGSQNSEHGACQETFDETPDLFIGLNSARRFSAHWVVSESWVSWVIAAMKGVYKSSVATPALPVSHNVPWWGGAGIYSGHTDQGSFVADPFLV